MGLPGPAARLLEDFSTFERLPAPMALLSCDGRVLRANAAVAELVGRSEAELLGVDGLGLLAADRQAAAAAVARLVGGGPDQERDLVLVRPDGGHVPGLARASAVRDAQGTVALLVVHAVPAATPDAAGAVALAVRRSQALTRLLTALRHDARRAGTVAAAAAEVLHDVVGGGVSVFFVDPADPVVLEAVAVRTGDPASEAELRRLYAETPLRADSGVFGLGCSAAGPLVLEHPWGTGAARPVRGEYASWLTAHPVRRLLLVPLTCEGRVLGLLASGRHGETPFDEDGVRCAGEVARVVSTVLADLQLLALEQATARRDRAVARVVRRCEHTMGEPARMLEAVVEAVAAELEAACAAWLLDEDGRVTRAAVSHPDPAVAELARPVLSTWAERSTSFVPRVLAEGRASVVGRQHVVELISRFEESRERAEDLAVESLYGVRLAARGQTVGVLAVAGTDGRLAVADRHLVDALADRIALALDNAALLEAARSSRSRARALVEHCSDLLLLADAAGAITYASPAAARAFGGRLGSTLLHFVVPEDRPRVVRTWEALQGRPGLSPPLDVSVVDVEGRRRRLSAVANNLLHDPTVAGVVLTVRDVTEERAATERLAERAGQQAALAAIGASALTADLPQLHALVAKSLGETLDSTTSGVLQRLPDGDWVVLGASDARTLGERFAAPADSGLRRVLDSGRPLLVEDYLTRDDVDEASVVEDWGLRSGVLAPVVVDGAVWGAVTAHSAEPARFSAVDLDFVGTVATVVAGAVERDAMSRRVLAQAATDELTGLPNRVVVHALLDEELAADGAGPPSLLLLDLDDFKDVNDSLGHGVGDSVIAQLARRLSAVVGDRGTVARLGGDEFAVVLRGPEAGDPERLAEDITRSVAEPFALPGIDVTLSASLGIAVAPEHGRTADALLQAADMAMYRAKLERSRWAVYDAGLDSRRAERLALLAELRVALSSGELVLHYQPLVDLSSERVVAVEALLRWQHPRRGLLLPGDFLPTAESTDLVHALTRHVVRAAVRQARVWRAQGWHGTVSVNVAAPALRPPEVVEALREELLRGDGTVTVELTESALFDERAREAVRTLASAGIEISVDDFGTGWSALSYLRELPLNRLKLDRAFNRDVDTDERDAAIVGSVVQMAHALGLDVVAEGVETADVAQRLRELGVDVAQGWLYGRPQPASALRLV
jgi:diguanylate cyclase (GGDEF)-like protein/PAS domain S-box-containing protein